ncbi:MAG: nucleotidyltransferase domain-containing protein [Acidobacteria bacterium]|nr:nucleotidyltransferase domain-containing protein [Acidobacteriota bacterium]
MSLPTLKSIERSIKRCVVGRKEIQAAYVFGSAARERMRHDSDIDVAVLLNEKVPGSKFVDIRLRLMTDLGSALRRSDIDVAVLNQATPLLAHRVLSKGKLVFERSASARIRFQVQTANRYQDLIPMYEIHMRYFKKSVREGRIIG